MADHERQTITDELLDVLSQGPDAERFAAEAAAAAAGRLGLEAPGGCSIAVERHRRPRLVVQTPGLRAPAEDTEYGPGSPGGTVLGGGPEVVVRDLAAGQPWRTLTAAAETSLRSVAVASLDLGTDRGVLSCYADRPQMFGPGEMGSMRLLAADVARALRTALLLDAHIHRAANLQAALESRTVVDLAAGIIMGQNGCSQQAAIDILRSVSNSRNIKIRNVAAGVVSAVSDRVHTHFDE